MADVDIAIIGGGVSGLATAWTVAASGRSVCLLERHPRPGMETSTHNSGVIHAGLYYPAGTLKAQLCVEGRERLYAFCREHGVPHRRCGKLVIAHEDADVPRLHALKASGDANGVTGLRIVDRGFIAEREPMASGVAALYSPVSGIVEAEALVQTLQRLAAAGGAIILPGTRLIAAASEADGMRLVTEREEIVAGQVVNAAGLYADEVSRLLGGQAFTISPCRGEYVELTGAVRSRINGLIYPLPHTHGLGVHVVKTLHDVVWLGPTVRFQARKDDYEADRLPVDAFLEPARRILRDITLADLRLAGSGIRAKLHGPETGFADFLIERDRRNPRVVQAAGIESPGLTSCLAVGARVSRILTDTVRGF